MDEKTRRPLTWIIIVAVIVAIVIIAIYRRTEMDRLANTIAYGSPAQRIQAVRALVAKQKLMEALEDRPRWVMDNAVAAIPYVGDNDAYFELLTTHAVLDAPVQARDQYILTRLGPRGVEIFLEAIQDKDGVTRGTAKAPLIAIGKAMAGMETDMGNLVIDGCIDLIDAWDQYVRDLVRDILAGIALPAVTDRLIPIMQKTEPGQKTLPDGTVRDESTQEYMRARATAEAALIAMKVPAIQPIIDNLLTFESPDVRGNACRVLGVICDQAAALVPPAAAVPVVQPLIDRLNNDPQWAVQRRAATALGLLRDVAIYNGVVPVLISHLGDRPEVKAAVVEALGRIGDLRAVGPLVNTLVTNRRGATTELRIALTAMGESAIPALSGVLGNPEGEVRLIATQAVAEIGGPNAVVPLGGMLKDADVAIRRVAADALRDIADVRVLPQVAAALGDPDWKVYHAARDALANVGPAAVPVLVDALGSGNPRVNSMAIEALARIGDAALPALRTALSSPSAVRAHWAAIALGKVGYSAVGPAKAVLQNTSFPVTARAEAALALGRTGAGDAVEPLLAALARQEPAVQVQAIKALDELADARATEGLVAALESPSSDVRDAAMDVLRDWRLGDVQKALRKLSSSPDQNTKRRAAILMAEQTAVATHELLEDIADLGASKQEGAQVTDVSVLLAAATDTKESAKVRDRAIHALGYVGTEGSLTPLATLLRPGSQFAAQAAVAVARIGERVAPRAQPGKKPEITVAGKTLIDLMLSTQDDELRAKVAAGLSMMGENVVWELLERLKREPTEKKLWIMATLGAIGKPATEPVLEARGESDDNEYRSWLVATLPLIGDAQALDLIKHLAAEDQPQPDKVAAAAELLNTIRSVSVR